MFLLAFLSNERKFRVKEKKRKKNYIRGRGARRVSVINEREIKV